MHWKHCILWNSYCSAESMCNEVTQKGLLFWAGQQGQRWEALSRSGQAWKVKAACWLPHANREFKGNCKSIAHSRRLNKNNTHLCFINHLQTALSFVSCSSWLRSWIISINRLRRAPKKARSLRNKSIIWRSILHFSLWIVAQTYSRYFNLLWHCCNAIQLAIQRSSRMKCACTCLAHHDEPAQFQSCAKLAASRWPGEYQIYSTAKACQPVRVNQGESSQFCYTNCII